MVTDAEVIPFTQNTEAVTMWDAPLAAVWENLLHFHTVIEGN